MPGDFRFDFEAIGTKWVIDVQGKTANETRLLLKKIQEEIGDFSHIFSRFEKDSEISLAGKSKRKIKLSKKYLNLVDIYQKLYKLTGGMFSPLVGNLLVEAGYDENYSLTPTKLKPLLTWDEVLNYSSPFLEIKKPWILDFGAGGKGFLADLVGNVLKDEGITSYCIDAGGDILYKTKSNEPLKVGLEHPENSTQVLGVAEIINQSICGSSGNRRTWGKYHHIFNPKTLNSAFNVLAVWVVADTGLVADALSTSLFLVTPELLESHFEFEYLIVYPDLSLKRSKDFPGEIFYN